MTFNVEMTLEHWKEHRPKMYKRLEKDGLLMKKALKAVEHTIDDLTECLRTGYDYAQAWEIVRERYILLPPEKGQPD